MGVSEKIAEWNTMPGFSRQPANVSLTCQGNLKPVAKVGLDDSFEEIQLLRPSQAGSSGGWARKVANLLTIRMSPYCIRLGLGLPPYTWRKKLFNVSLEGGIHF
ncbi:hypothetical protein PM082_007627 [Marasmius tenuissimus]|nr:hypothetical protein PM082_007627 [Marasmius tenuissimus]